MIEKQRETPDPTARWEFFLRTLSERVSKASEENPSARCWKPSTLQREISTIKKANPAALLTNFGSALKVIERLKRIGWVHPIKAQSSVGAESIEFLLLEMESGNGQPIYPLELLQAYLPDGVICYFSAIVYHELTTQVATHHHIARLEPPKDKTSWDASLAPEPRQGGEPVEKNPLGTAKFRFEDIDYYLNRRNVSLLPGIQFRVVTPRCWLRITTLEQTLLDALMQPICCGGEAVALEAWEAGVKQMDADRMAEHLAKIQRGDLERRVGAILDLIGVNFKATPLGSRLDAVRARLLAEDAPATSLLAGFEFPELNKTWKVRTP